jgi:hypothetical protein
VIAVAVAVPAFVWAGLRLSEDDPAPLGANAPDPGMSHVHGLGIDPDDGTLIAATHFGVFRIRNGEPSRIGDSFQDTMGFTVADDGRFIGSGHPDLAGIDRGLPALLGLIESDDGGSSWTPVALEGEADFHAIATSGGVIYAWDSASGVLYRSEDEAQPEPASTLDVLALAADPDDADIVVAATPQGLMRSTDGAQTWEPWEGPDLVSVSWSATSGLWGATAGGEVWERLESGWRLRGNAPGEVHVLLAGPDSQLFAAGLDGSDATAIWRSDDEGVEWILDASDQPVSRP